MKMPRTAMLVTTNGANGARVQIEEYSKNQPFNGRLSGTTRVGRYKKKHSPAHTHPGQRTFVITFLHLNDEYKMRGGEFTLEVPIGIIV